MNTENYNLKAEATLTRFEFVSEGPKGAIRKLIEFQKTTFHGLFNLAFGDKDQQTGEMNDLSFSGNGDTDKVLATVVSSVYEFFEKYPNAYVYASGSTKARTRLYRMGISRFYEEIKEDFFVWASRRQLPKL